VADKLGFLVNRPLDKSMSGVNVREVALSHWAADRSATVVAVRTQEFESSRVARLMAVWRVLASLWRMKKHTVILAYPGFPFFWSLDSVPQLLRAFVFAFGCKIVGILRGQRIVVDIMDLPRFQHVDLHYPVGLPIRLFRFFDLCVFHLSTELWVCSDAIARLIKREMLFGSSRVRTVENGTFPSDYDVTTSSGDKPPRVFVYAGQLHRSRGVGWLIEEFCRCKRSDVELHVCGDGGEWISDAVSDPRVKYLGRLNHDECARAVANGDVGIVYQPRGSYYDIVYPTKLPLYIGRGKPVIATDNPELSRAVLAMKVGLVVPANDIAKTIDGLDAGSLAGFAQNCAALRESVQWYSLYDRALGDEQ